jgi:hypothetical protein
MRAREFRVNVLGISYPSYAELFPQHVAQYEDFCVELPAGTMGEILDGIERVSNTNADQLISDEDI